MTTSGRGANMWPNSVQEKTSKEASAKGSFSASPSCQSTSYFDLGVWPRLLPLRQKRGREVEAP